MNDKENFLTSTPVVDRSLNYYNNNIIVIVIVLLPKTILFIDVLVVSHLFSLPYETFRNSI